MGLLDGMNALIFGVANDHSIAWGIARTLARHGAELAFTYQGEALEKRVICDMYEGNAPYRPRYVLPDYPKALRQGSQFLELPPPTDLDEALKAALAQMSGPGAHSGHGQ